MVFKNNFRNRKYIFLSYNLKKFNLDNFSPFQVLFACVAAASAQLVEYPNGAVAPVKTPEVQAAEAAHFAAYAGAYPGYAGYAGYAGAYNGYAGAYPGYAGAYNGYAGIYNGYANTAAYAGAYAQPLAYNNLYNPIAYAPALVAHPNGAVVPVDEPAVQAARAEHLAAAGLTGYAAGYGYAAAPYAVGYAGLVAHPNGAVVPVDEPAVQAARAEHFAALATAA